MKKRGFTLLELIVVMIIIGVLASLGLPQFSKIIEKARATEAVLLLKEVRSAQLRYATEEEGLTTDQFENLDINYTVLKYFDPVVLTGDINVEANPESDIAHISRKSNSLFSNYYLYINTNGNVTCFDEGRDLCEKLGFPEE